MRKKDYKRGAEEVEVMAKNNKRKRRRIVSNGRREFSSSNYATDSATSQQLRRKRSRPTAEVAEEENFAPDGSCCSSSNGSAPAALVDLEEQEFESVLQDEHSTRETTPTRTDFCSSDEQKMDSNAKRTTTAEANSNSALVKTTMPVKIPHSDLEDFFAEAEKTIHERFAEKYNYDVVKDIPLDGRYEWEQLKR